MRSDCKLHITHLLLSSRTVNMSFDKNELNKYCDILLQSHKLLSSMSCMDAVAVMLVACDYRMELLRKLDVKTESEFVKNTKQLLSTSEWEDVLCRRTRLARNKTFIDTLCRKMTFEKFCIFANALCFVDLSLQYRIGEAYEMQGKRFPPSSPMLVK